MRQPLKQVCFLALLILVALTASLAFAAKTLTLDLTGLEPLAEGFYYEGWAIIEGEPVSTGRFNIDGMGGLVGPDGAAIENGAFAVDRDLSGASAIVITIERAGVPGPSKTKVLAGSLMGDVAALSVAHELALGDDFKGASGSFILATPTEEPANANPLSGVWFLALTESGPVATLELPALPEGWVYEGWAVVDGMPVTTGRFRDGTMADYDAPFSGPNPGPNYPGEDFLHSAPMGMMFPTDLSGATVVITIEPEPDDSPSPFALKPLVYELPASAEHAVSYTLVNKAASFPTGTATLR
jgi:hypothetical protein